LILNDFCGEILATQLHLKYRRTPLRSILLVDDSRFMRIVNEKALAKAGYSVVTASEGEEALRIAHAAKPDITVLDMLLPKLGGPEVLRALKKNPSTAPIPVVVLSSLSQKNEVKLMQEGAVAYFEKSRLDLDQNAETLVEVVQTPLDRVAGINRLKTQDAMTTASDVS
jgi:CheY-like chemotaxis protein